METRRCAICGENKPLDHFNTKVKHADRTIYDAYCRPCRREYRQRHYQANKKDYFRRVRERERRIYETVVCAAKARPCADCGIQFSPWQMDFDHVQGKKVMAIARRGSKSYSIRKLLEEIAKREVVCANCHRDRTHFRQLAQKAAREAVNAPVRSEA